MREKRSKTGIKLDALYRYGVWQGWIPKKGMIAVSEFPKSGGTWFCQMLSHAVGIPFPRNTRLPKGDSIVHSHLTPKAHHKSPIIVIRDGRDVMVSAYFHFIVGHSYSPTFLTQKWREKMPFSDYENVTQNMSVFIDIFSEEYKVGGKSVSWANHINAGLKHENGCIVKYEDLLTNPAQCLSLTIDHLHLSKDLQKIQEGVAKYAFSKQTNRVRGQENNNSFLRKGIAGDWKNYFNPAACESFDKLAGDMLIRLGYEKDHNWY